jgi:small-conductance mechanosensitive channel
MDMSGPIVLFIIFGGSALIVAMSLFFAYKREQMKTQERLAAIEKGLTAQTPESERLALLERLGALDGDRPSGYAHTPREREIYSGLKTLIIGLGLAVALYVGVDEEVAIWGLFVAFVGLAKLAVGFIMRRPGSASGTEG